MQTKTSKLLDIQTILKSVRGKEISLQEETRASSITSP